MMVIDFLHVCYGFVNFCESDAYHKIYKILYTIKFSTCTIFMALKTSLLNASLPASIQASNSKSMYLIKM